MKRILLAGAALLAAGLISGAANAADTIKIGIILPYSGQFADAATQLDNGIKLYVTSVESTRRPPNGWRKNSSPATKSTFWPASC